MHPRVALDAYMQEMASEAVEDFRRLMTDDGDQPGPQADAFATAEATIEYHRMAVMRQVGRAFDMTVALAVNEKSYEYDQNTEGEG